MFNQLIVISPLGLLYGSSGSFLSPENLVGRSGNRFPPSSATVSGLFASVKDLDISNLRIAGPFWAKSENPTNFFVPTPFNLLANKPLAQINKENPDDGQIKYHLAWNDIEKAWRDLNHEEISGKFDSESWLAIEQWHNPQQVYQAPWKYLPHLHPRLEDNERKVKVVVQNEQQGKQGSLFLENAVQLDPDACLVYLSNQKLPDGWYRFGGEGHMVDIQSIELSDYVIELLSKPVGKQFALITPAVWGSNRLSHRLPESWEKDALLTDRPVTFRYRLGGQGPTKRLSRGRYAVPAGTVYLLKSAIEKAWFYWDQDWFPKEGYPLSRWGCGLALPL